MKAATQNSRVLQQPLNLILNRKNILTTDKMRSAMRCQSTCRPVCLRSPNLFHHRSQRNSSQEMPFKGETAKDADNASSSSCGCSRLHRILHHGPTDSDWWTRRHKSDGDSNHSPSPLLIVCFVGHRLVRCCGELHRSPLHSYPPKYLERWCNV